MKFSLLDDNSHYSGNPLSWANELLPQIFVYIVVISVLLWIANLLRKEWLRKF